MNTKILPEVQTLSKEQHKQQMEQHLYQVSQLNKKINMNGDQGFLGGDLKARNYHNDMFKMHQNKYNSIAE